VDDFAVLIDAAGGSACLYGFSSGVILALRAAASGLAIPRLALPEPPITTEDEKPGGSDVHEQVGCLVTEGRRWDAVELIRRSIGVPPEIIDQMEPEARAAV